VKLRYLLVGVWLLLSTGSRAEEAALPSPLTLKQALTLADRLPVEVMAVTQAQAEVAARRFAARQEKRLRLSLEGKIGAYQYLWDFHRHHRLALVARKVLYDGGREAALLRALNTLDAALDTEKSVAQARYRLKIVEAFFNILLADLRYRMLNEEMAVVYVTLDRMRDRHQLGTVSDVTLAEQEKRYAELLLARTEAELVQRQRRLELAILLNRPDAVIDEVKPPAVDKILAAPLPDVAALLKQLPHRSPELLAIRQKLASLVSEQQWAALQKAPTLSAQVATGPRYVENEVDKQSWNVQLQLSWPILDGGVTQTTQMQVEARRLKWMHEYKQRRQQLEQRVVQLWAVAQAQPARQTWLARYRDYVDLNMEYKRGLYENEEKADIGDAMIEQSRYDYAELEALFKTLLARYELNTIMGEQWP